MTLLKRTAAIGITSKLGLIPVYSTQYKDILASDGAEVEEAFNTNFTIVEEQLALKATDEDLQSAKNELHDKIDKTKEELNDKIDTHAGDQYSHIKTIHIRDVETAVTPGYYIVTSDVLALYKPYYPYQLMFVSIENDGMQWKVHQYLFYNNLNKWEYRYGTYTSDQTHPQNWTEWEDVETIINGLNPSAINIQSVLGIELNGTTSNITLNAGYNLLLRALNGKTTLSGTTGIDITSAGGNITLTAGTGKQASYKNSEIANHNDLDDINQKINEQLEGHADNQYIHIKILTNVSDIDSAIIPGIYIIKYPTLGTERPYNTDHILHVSVQGNRTQWIIHQYLQMYEPHTWSYRSGTYISGEEHPTNWTEWQDMQAVLNGNNDAVNIISQQDANITSQNGEIHLNTNKKASYNDSEIATHTDLSKKQDTLISGTNIKTVNNTSLVGSGNVAVQPTLVSGTNIKTVNKNSLLGSGDIEVQPVLQSGSNIKTINETSILGNGNIAVQPVLESGSNIKTINNDSILGNGNIPLQVPLVSGQNIKTVNGYSLLGGGDLELKTAESPIYVEKEEFTLNENLQYTLSTTQDVRAILLIVGLHLPFYQDYYTFNKETKTITVTNSAVPVTPNKDKFFILYLVSNLPTLLTEELTADENGKITLPVPGGETYKEIYFVISGHAFLFSNQYAQDKANNTITILDPEEIPFTPGIDKFLIMYSY